MKTVLVIVLLCSPLWAATTHYVWCSAAGSASGADFTNAFTDLPSSLTRTDTYVMVRNGCIYGAHTFNDNESSTSLITIRAAVASSDSGVAGWQSAFGTGQAFVRSSLTWVNADTGNNLELWWIRKGYYTIDGFNCTANGLQTIGSQGLRLDNGSSSATISTYLSALREDPGLNSVTLNCLDIVGSGNDSDAGNATTGNGGGNSHAISTITCNSGGTAASIVTADANRYSATYPPSQIAISGTSGFNNGHVLVATVTNNTNFTVTMSCTPNATESTGKTNGTYDYGEQTIFLCSTVSPCGTGFTLSNSTIRNSANAPVQWEVGGTNFTFQYNDFNVWSSNMVQHGEAFTLGNGGGTFSNTIIRYNRFLDGEGSGIIVPLNGAQVSGLDFYGNIIALSNGNSTGRTSLGDGLVACINASTSCATIHAYNNTCANVTTTGQSGWVTINLDSSGTTGSAVTIENNLSYNCHSPVNWTSATSDYNTYINYTGTAPAAETHGSNQLAAANPFVSDSTLNYALSSETVDPHLNDGLSLASPYNTDMFGATRGADGTWERGAFEFITGTPSIRLILLSELEP